MRGSINQQPWQVFILAQVLLCLLDDFLQRKCWESSGSTIYLEVTSNNLLGRGLVLSANLPSRFDIEGRRQPMKVEHVFWLESPLSPKADRYTDMDLCLAGQFSTATPPRFS